jgi:hypothetical protein
MFKMPTGYTYQVQSGEVKSEKDFILHCAEQFGALAPRRDENFSMNKFRKYVPEDSYYVKKYKEAKDGLLKFKLMSDNTIRNEIINNYNKKIKDNKDYKKKLQQERNRYITMLSKVENWNPPTQEHAGLKRFCIEQLTESIKFDCSSDYVPDIPKPNVTKQGIDIYRDRYIEEYEKDIKYYKDKANDEIEKAKERNAWIEQLLNSFNQ